MPDTNARALSEGPAVPLSLTVHRDGGHWHLQVWYHGSTVHEALHPVLVLERHMSTDRVPVNASWHTLWFHVADALVDMADGQVDAHYQA